MAESEENNIEYATFNSRMIASVIDTILSAALLVPLLSIINNAMGLATNLDQQAVIHMSEEQMVQLMLEVMKSSSIQMLIFGAIVIIFWHYRGATPGKMIMRISVVNAKTLEKLSFTRSIVRFFAYNISALPLCLGFIWIFYDKKGQGFHDKIAGSVVIKDKINEEK